MKELTERAFEPFDFGLYGMLVRKMRTDLGYRKAEDFVRTLYLRTRMSMSKETLYKIEQGKQVPNTAQFLALNLALTGELIPEKVASLCLSREWEQIIYVFNRSSKATEGAIYCTPNCPFVPQSWFAENIECLTEELGELSECEEHSSDSPGNGACITIEVQAKAAGEPLTLFSPRYVYVHNGTLSPVPVPPPAPAPNAPCEP